MKMATGRVVSGKVVVEGEALEEGETVTVPIHDDEETFELGSEDRPKAEEVLRRLPLTPHSNDRDLSSGSHLSRLAQSGWH
jgi:hypothetical protein